MPSMFLLYNMYVWESMESFAGFDMRNVCGPLNLNFAVLILFVSLYQHCKPAFYSCWCLQHDTINLRIFVMDCHGNRTNLITRSITMSSNSYNFIQSFTAHRLNFMMVLWPRKFQMQVLLDILFFVYYLLFMFFFFVDRCFACVTFGISCCICHQFSTLA